MHRSPTRLFGLPRFLISVGILFEAGFPGPADAFAWEPVPWPRAR
jgi:hypothetical protein